MNKNLIAIYDFSLFPYALGDLTTWYIKKNCEAIDLGYSKVFFVLISPNQLNFFQNKNLFKEKKIIINDLMCIPKFLQIKNKITVINNYSSLKKIITEHKIPVDDINFKIIKKYEEKKALNDKNKAIQAILNPHSNHYKFLFWMNESIPNKFRIRYLKPIYRKFFSGYFNFRKTQQNTFNKEVASHKDLNSFFKKNNYFPYIKYNKLTKNRNAISMQFRFRKLDSKVFSQDAIDRDSSIIVWTLLIELFAYFFPKAKIYLLGRLQEKPRFLYKYKNLYFRKKNQTLDNDLNKMFNSSCFLGSSSGFAALANFSDLPYMITKVNNEARKNYLILQKEEKLPFALKNQILTKEEDPISLLKFYCKVNNFPFKKILLYLDNKQNLFKKDKNDERRILNQNKIKNNNLLLNEYNLSSENEKYKKLFYLYIIGNFKKE